MHNADFYRQNPWFRADDESFLMIFDAETGISEQIAAFDDLIEAPNWSKDGEALYYNRSGRICRYDLAVGKETVVPSDYADNCNNDHVLSPDGLSIAVSHGTREDGQSRIYTLPLTGGIPRLVTPLGPSYLHGWSPDGRTLAYCAERGGEFDIYTIPAEGGVERRLTDSAGLNDGPEYSPDGAWIWFSSVRTGLMQVWKMRADGSEETQMTFDGDRNSWFPHISPDGRRVVFLAYRKGGIAPDKHLPHHWVELRLMDADGGDLKTVERLFGGQGTINVNSWAPDSRRFAYVKYRIRGIGEL